MHYHHPSYHQILHRRNSRRCQNMSEYNHYLPPNSHRQTEVPKLYLVEKNRIKKKKVILKEKWLDLETF